MGNVSTVKKSIFLTRPTVKTYKKLSWYWQIPATRLCQIGLFEVEYMVPGTKMLNFKNAVTWKSGFRPLDVIENDTF